MLIELSFKSSKPVYAQIVEQVKYASASGALRAGDRLPSIRALAERLRINRNTVAKAYLKLEQEGVAETRQGKGVFVTGEQSPFNKRLRKAILAESIDAVLVQAHHLQFDSEAFAELLRGRVREFEKRRRKTKTEE